MRAQRLGVAGLEQHPERALAQDLLVDGQPAGDRDRARAQRAHEQARGRGLAARRGDQDVRAREHVHLVGLRRRHHLDAVAQARAQSARAPAGGGRVDRRPPVGVRGQAAQGAQEHALRLALLVIAERDPQRPAGRGAGRRLGAGEHDVVRRRERPLHQRARRLERGGARVEAAEEALHEPARDLRRDDALRRRVERADVERARVAERHRRGARRERLVHVHEVQRRVRQHLLERAGDVERRRRRRSPPRRREREQLADRQHAHAAVVGEELAGPDEPAGLAHERGRARRREHQQAVPRARELIAQRRDERVDLVRVLPRVRRDLRDGEAVAHQRARVSGRAARVSRSRWRNGPPPRARGPRGRGSRPRAYASAWR